MELQEAYRLEGNDNICLIKPGHPGQEKRPLVRKGAESLGSIRMMRFSSSKIIGPGPVAELVRTMF